MNKKKAPLVSVIIPSYNVVNTIEETILSVLNQNKELFELIVVDGNSNDGTKKILKKYDNEIKYISEPDNGVYDAMNKGIDLASGEYLYFLGSGDALRSNIFNTIKQELERNSCYLVYGNVYRKDLGKIYDGKFSKIKLLFTNISHQSIFYKNEIFKKSNYYKLEYKVLADYDLNIKCFANENIKKKYVDLIIADYIGDGISANNIDEAFYKAKKDIIRKKLGFMYYLIFKVGKFSSKILSFFGLKKIILRDFLND